MTNSLFSRSPAAERMRLHRERRRRGLRCVMIELREAEVDALISGGLLEQETRNDRNAVLQGAVSSFQPNIGTGTVTRNSATDRLTIKDLRNDALSVCELRVGVSNKAIGHCGRRQ